MFIRDLSRKKIDCLIGVPQNGFYMSRQTFSARIFFEDFQFFLEFEQKVFGWCSQT